MKQPKYIKSPMNYIGGKYRLLKQILPFFPTNINTFVDLFAGGCNVGINVKSNKTYFNDNLSYLIDLYKEFQNLPLQDVLNHIDERIKQFELSKTNADGYLALRSLYNEKRNPLDLFVLVAYSFNHQIRFNNSHGFNNPFGKDRSSYNESMKQNLINFINTIKENDCVFSNVCFTDFDFSGLGSNDLVYCDPPYLITTGTYNDGKRGFKGWGTKEEFELLNTLDELNKNKVKFALSNVIDHKGKSNDILKEWIAKNDYTVHYLNASYANSNYQSSANANKISVEVLITNY